MGTWENINNRRKGEGDGKKERGRKRKREKERIRGLSEDYAIIRRSD